KLISSSPRGTVFQLSFCLLLHNVIVVLCAQLARGQGLALSEVSEEMVFEDVKEELVALARVLGGPAPPGPSPGRGGPGAGEGEGWSVRLAALRGAGGDAGQARQRLGELLRGRWRRIWAKAANKKRRPHPDKPRRRIHCCVHRVVESAKPQKHSQLGTSSFL